MSERPITYDQAVRYEIHSSLIAWLIPRRFHDLVISYYFWKAKRKHARYLYWSEELKR